MLGVGNLALSFLVFLLDKKLHFKLFLPTQVCIKELTIKIILSAGDKLIGTNILSKARKCGLSCLTLQ